MEGDVTTLRFLFAFFGVDKRYGDIALQEINRVVVLDASAPSVLAFCRAHFFRGRCGR